jgi:hypothetical protein
MSCRAETAPRFGGTYRVKRQGGAVRHARNQKTGEKPDIARPARSPGSLLGLLLHSEHGFLLTLKLDCQSPRAGWRGFNALEFYWRRGGGVVVFPGSSKQMSG